MTLVEHSNVSPRTISVDEALIAERRHRWTPEQYMALGEALPQRTELIDGEIIDVASQKNPHVACISKIVRQLTAVFDDRYWVTVQSTIRLPSGNIPDPDFAVRPGPVTADDNVHPLPLLVIEVSDTTLLFDRRIKAGLYASNGIQEYWIVNLEGRCVEVMRQPVQDESRKFGWRYSDVTIVAPPQRLVPVSRPDLTIEVAQMLP